MSGAGEGPGAGGAAAPGTALPLDLRGKFGLWYQAARPGTLAASVAPVLVGVSIAVHDGRSRPLPALAALVVALALQVGVNYANDYSDFQRGADTPARIGPMRAAASGLVTPGAVRTAAILAFAVAGAAGFLLCLAVDPRLLAVGLLSILAGWLYTGGPRPYGYMGLGEVFVFVFFGLVATVGTVYVQELRVTPLAVAGGVSTGCLAMAILVLNNLRDIDTDRAAGKHTLAVKLGRPATRVELVALFTIASLVPIAMVATGQAGRFLLLTLAATPLLVKPARAAFEVTGPPLVAALRAVGKAELVFALLWALAMVLP
jgi:1,4-dihydroxy-2-naphthoate octaprenyltransferase